MLATITVTSFADDGGGSKITLREAVDTANFNDEDDTIIFSTDLEDGLNGATILLTPQFEVSITESVTIDASMLPDGIIIKAFDPSPLVKEGNGSRIFNMSGSPDAQIEIELDGLTLTGGDTPPTSPLGLTTPGGAIYSRFTNLTIQNSTISDNGSRHDGGGIYVRYGSLTLENSTITGNTSGRRGGGIYFYDIDQNTNEVLTIRDSQISGNSAGVFGGGLYARSRVGVVDMVSSTFESNWVNPDLRSYVADGPSDGGGIYMSVYAATVTMTNITISGNRAEGIYDGVYGSNIGGIALTASQSSIDPWSVTLDRVRVIDNHADDDVGGLFLNNLASSVAIKNSTISGNTAANIDTYYSGGGGAWLITQAGGTTTLESSTVSDNSSLASSANNDLGGGLYIEAETYTTTTVRNTTISGNRSDGSGGGIVVAGNHTGGQIHIGHSTITENRADADGSSGGSGGSGGGIFRGNANTTITLNHTIVAGNVSGAESTPDDIFGAVTASSAYNLIGVNTGMTGVSDGNQGNKVGTSLVPIDPKLGPLVYNGGPTFLDGSGMLTHALLPGSPALNMGDGSIVPSETEFDQRGDPWTRVAGTSIDIGAFEWRPYAATGDYNVDGRVDAGDYVRWRNTLGSTTDLRADGNQNGVVDAGDYGWWKDYYGEPPADFNGSGGTDFADFILWQSTYGSTTDLRADGNEDGIVDDADFEIWFDTFGSTMEVAQFGMLSSMFGADAAPAVVGFALGMPGVGATDFADKVGSGEQIRSVPVIAANTLNITFSRDVNITSGALQLVNLDGTSPTLFDFAYDPLAQTATWTFTTSLADGRYLVRLSDSVESLDGKALDGEFTNPWFLSETGTSTFPSGNGKEGGEFRFRFTVLSGDSDHDNVHGATDYQSWHSYEPGMILVSSLADEVDTDYSHGDLSLREALVIAAGQAGWDKIVFASSLFAGGPATITLSYDGADAGTAPDRLSVVDEVTIEGPAANLLSISGDGQTGVFSVNWDVEAVIRGVRITGGAASMGAGIITSGALLVDRVEIEDNSAGSGVGGGIWSSGALLVVGSTLASNSAYGGGGLFVAAGVAVVKNSTLSGNLATVGGGIYGDMGSLTVASATITANRANTGSGILSWNLTMLYNSIVAGNLNSAGAATTNDIFGYFDTASAYNLIGYDGSQSNGINHGTNGNQVGGELGAAAIDAMLTALDYYGGTVKTHRLLAGSPAIDAGSNDLAIAYSLDEDQDGGERIVDWLGDDLEAQVDIGAVELAADEIYS